MTIEMICIINKNNKRLAGKAEKRTENLIETIFPFLESINMTHLLGQGSTLVFQTGNLGLKSQRQSWDGQHHKVQVELIIVLKFHRINNYYTIYNITI